MSDVMQMNDVIYIIHLLTLNILKIIKDKPLLFQKS